MGGDCLPGYHVPDEFDLIRHTQEALQGDVCGAFLVGILAMPC